MYFHFNYCVAILKDLEIISRYIELCEDNYDTYSIEILKLYISASSEFEAVCKEMYKIINLLKSVSRKKRITDFLNSIFHKFPDINTEPCYINRSQITITPFDFLHIQTKIKMPDWWNSYNNLKHTRNEYYNCASLKNLLYSISALVIINYYYLLLLKEKDNNIDPADIFYDLPNIVTIRDELQIGLLRFR